MNCDYNGQINMEQKKRIEFIDLAKGVCILLVVAGHCGFPINIPGWEIVRMPLYFILSGLFFKDYGGWVNFLVQKTNKILIPFLFFYLLGNLAYYLIQWLAPGVLVTAARGFGDMFTNRQFFNGPIWFLLCLFWCNVIFCTITLYIKSETLKIAVVCLLGFVGWYSGNVLNLFVPLFFDVALTALPFFALGYYLKRTPLLFPNRYDKYNLLFALLFWTVAFVLTRKTHFHLSLHYNVLEGWSTYFIAIASVMSILFLCKAIKHLPFVSYFGRYSIIPLCVHHLIYRPVKVALNHCNISEWGGIILLTIITILICWAAIPLCIRFIPWFTAQKDLIRLKKSE